MAARGIDMVAVGAAAWRCARRAADELSGEVRARSGGVGELSKAHSQKATFPQPHFTCPAITRPQGNQGARVHAEPEGASIADSPG